MIIRYHVLCIALWPKNHTVLGASGLKAVGWQKSTRCAGYSPVITNRSNDEFRDLRLNSKPKLPSHGNNSYVHPLASLFLFSRSSDDLLYMTLVRVNGIMHQYSDVCVKPEHILLLLSSSPLVIIIGACRRTLLTVF
jgi:hypothetical protein